jgi:6-phosphogluconolactonase (cycloisomerase 2 family)
MAANVEYVFVGCYTGDKGGEGDGITLLRRDPGTGVLTRLGLAARTPSPSFLAQHPSLPVLYAVNELDQGTVAAFAVGADCTLTPLAVRSTGGADPCHLAVTADGRHLVVAKSVSSGRTRTEVREVTGDERVGEIARMLGGAKLTSVVTRHARELLALAAS